MIFLDTSFLGALFMKNDQWHDAAHQWAARVTMPLLTTDCVLLEPADGLARPAWRQTFAKILDALHASPNIEIVPQSPPLFTCGLELYRSRPDKEWSLTDCLSFVVMSDRNCTLALTSDVHFEQAGFEALLRQG